MTPVLKALKIYPVFFLWRTGLWEELRDVLTGPGQRAAARVQELSDVSDLLLETFARSFVRPVWQEMKRDATRAVFPGTLPNAVTGEGWKAASLLVTGARDAGMRVHFVGHSAGAILLGELLSRAFAAEGTIRDGLGTISLFAPACTEDYFEALQDKLHAVLGANPASIVIYNLPDELEREDTVGGIYRKSLLYLVSNALEDKPETPILGFEKVAARVAARHSNVRLILSDEAGGESGSRSHSGFDDDPATLNHLVNRVLGKVQGKSVA